MMMMMIMIMMMMPIAYDYDDDDDDDDDDDSHFDGVELLDLNVVVVEVLHLLQLILQPDILISI